MVKILRTPKEKAVLIGVYFRKQEDEKLVNYARKKNLKKGTLVRQYIKKILNGETPLKQQSDIFSNESEGWVSTTLTFKPNEVELLNKKAEENNAKRGNFLRVEVLKFLSSDISNDSIRENNGRNVIPLSD